MAKDYTDYVALILEAEKRVFHIYHHRSKESAELTEIEHNGQSYIFDRDRAFRITKWKPWKKTNIKRPLWSLNELIRGKKVGLLLYHEPLPSKPKYRDVEHRTPKEFICKICGFTTVHDRGIKIHMRTRHKLKDYGNQVRVSFEVKIEKVPYFEKIQPIHISRMHQPSGEMKP